MTELEKQLRESKIANIKLLAEQMVAYKFNAFKDYEVPEDTDIPHLDAEIKMLKKQVKNAKLGQAKLIKFDKLEAERANLTPEELKELEATQKRNADIPESFLASLEPRASLKGRLQSPTSIMLRYRGKIGSKFNETYPYGVLQ